MAFFLLPAVAELTFAAATATAAFVYKDYHTGSTGDRSKAPEENDESDDEEIDGVKVSLYTRNVSLFSSSDGCSSGTSNFNLPEDLRHWNLVFNFPSFGRPRARPRFIIYEANEKETRLVWTCEKKKEAPKLEEGDKVHYMGKCRTSPKRLQEIARNIKINNLPYNMCLRNCQEWIKLFAKEIGGDVYCRINTHLKSAAEVNPWPTFLIGCAQAALYTGKKVKKILSEEQNHNV